MAAIKGGNTKPELLIRKLLFSIGFRYRLHEKNLPGKPDIVLTKYKTALFVHGCFWHSHQCHLGRRPKSNAEFWDKKLDSNLVRDQKNLASLSAMGWKIVVVWECGVKGKTKIPPDILKAQLCSAILNDSNELYVIEGILVKQ